MVAVPCAELVVGFTLVEGLHGISWSSFSMISFILRSVSVSETAGSGGTSKGNSEHVLLLQESRDSQTEQELKCSGKRSIYIINKEYGFSSV